MTKNVHVARTFEWNTDRRTRVFTLSACNFRNAVWSRTRVAENVKTKDENTESRYGRCKRTDGVYDLFVVIKSFLFYFTTVRVFTRARSYKYKISKRRPRKRNTIHEQLSRFVLYEHARRTRTIQHVTLSSRIDQLGISHRTLRTEWIAANPFVLRTRFPGVRRLFRTRVGLYTVRGRNKKKKLF